MASAAAPQVRSAHRAKRLCALNRPAVVLGVLLLLQFWLVLFRTINWDEFWFYSQIEQFQRGELTMALQTLHVRLFGWLASLPGSAVDRIIVGRVVMFGCELVSLTAIFAIARKFGDRQAALLCCVSYLSVGFVMQHGFSFRTDPLAAAASMAGLAILARSRLTLSIMCGFALLVGGAILVTMKSVLFAPAFIGIAWLRWSEDGFTLKSAMRLVAMAGLAMAAAGAIYVWHSGAVLPAMQAAGMSSDAVASSAAQKMFFIGVPEYLIYIMKAVLTAPVFALLCLLVPIALLPRTTPSAQRIALFGLFLPLTTLLFYHNSLPYYYPFILPPVAISLVPAIAMVQRRYSASLLLAAMAIPAIGLWLVDPPSEIAKQRAITRAADEIFPEPVAYFDFPAMLGHFSKANRFTTRWGREGYLSGGGPSYRQIMEQRTVPLLLVNDDLATAHFYDLMVVDPESVHFLPVDRKALRDNYIEFWGPFWLAGKQIAPAAEAVMYEFLVPGPYSITGAPVTIDGMDYPAGSIATLSRGRHLVENSTGKPAQLVWGEHLRKPASQPPERPYWTDF